MLWLAALFMIMLGSFVQSAIGFGLAIVAAPVLYLIDVNYVPAPITIVALVLSLFNAYQHRQSLSLGPLTYAIVGRVPGSLAGGALLMVVDARQLALVIGCSVLIAVVISLMPIRLAPTRSRMAIAGFFSGLFGTSTSIGGPPMAIILQHSAAGVIRANLSAFFVVSSLLSLVVQASTGYLRWSHLWLTLPLIPASLMGYWLARRYAGELSHQHMRWASLTLCSIAGGAALWSYLA
ncbi:sulfite exporter TauE/SafE family protein [Echinimonas agarilytica]|uniref:Probable membrane transporter protein n=2 Tax=Echinimonas agarilytica TaxID=1215918 RepID=A0AA41W8B4_9GAMM|nr:sulfite exporter TauE/SafE family protein [Echinimonas agarilytica]MCM2681102.1 sulfite exporter TauE/SafE family protein [Echinimonas agarilytica]